MSSPLAEAKKSVARELLVRLHQRLAHNNRVEILAREIGEAVRLAGAYGACLDIGCGDMRIAEALGAQLPGSHWKCLDVHPVSGNFAMLPQWRKYVQFDGASLPFGDATHDVAIFCDVLHHMEKSGMQGMLREAGRVACSVIVKDHFEYGFVSRCVLRCMDFFGNWAYGVSVPRRYFNERSFCEAAAAAGLTVKSLRIGVRLYEHLGWGAKLLPAKWQFVAVLSRP